MQRQGPMTPRRATATVSPASSRSAVAPAPSRSPAQASPGATPRQPQVSPASNPASVPRPAAPTAATPPRKTSEPPPVTTPRSPVRSNPQPQARSPVPQTPRTAAAAAARAVGGPQESASSPQQPVAVRSIASSPELPPTLPTPQTPRTASGRVGPASSPHVPQTPRSAAAAAGTRPPHPPHPSTSPQPGGLLTPRSKVAPAKSPEPPTPASSPVSKKPPLPPGASAQVTPVTGNRRRASSGSSTSSATRAAIVASVPGSAERSVPATPRSRASAASGSAGGASSSHSAASRSSPDDELYRRHSTSSRPKGRRRSSTSRASTKRDSVGAPASGSARRQSDISLSMSSVASADDSTTVSSLDEAAFARRAEASERAGGSQRSSSISGGSSPSPPSSSRRSKARSADDVDGRSTGWQQQQQQQLPPQPPQSSRRRASPRPGGSTRRSTRSSMMLEAAAVRLQSCWRRHLAIRIRQERERLHKLRTAVWSDFVTAERRHLFCLRTICEGFIAPLRGLPDMISRDDLEIIFPNMEMLYRIHGSFLSMVERLRKDWTPSRCVGGLFLEVSGHFYPYYLGFGREYESAILRMMQLQSGNINLDGFIKSKLSDVSTEEWPLIDLQDIMLAILTRPTAYAAHFAELAKHSWIDHPDLFSLEQSAMVSRRLSNELIDFRDRAEEMHRLMRVQHKIANIDYNLCARPRRTVIREGELMQLDTGNRNHRLFVLLSDALLSAKKELVKGKGMRWVYQGKIDLANAVLTVNSDAKAVKNHFELSNGAAKLNVVCPTESETAAWLKDLGSAIQELKNALAASPFSELRSLHAARTAALQRQQQLQQPEGSALARSMTQQSFSASAPRKGANGSDAGATRLQHAASQSAVRSTSPGASRTSPTSSLLPDVAPESWRFQAADFADKFFGEHKTGIFQRPVPVHDVLTWSKEPLRAPLLKLQKTAQKEALLVWKHISMFMGDTAPSAKLPTDWVFLVQNILFQAITQPELRDEIFCQLCKQTNHNPNPASCFKGWELVAIILESFGPTKNFEEFLRSYFAANANPVMLRSNPGHETCVKYATYCLKQLDVAIGLGSKPRTLTTAEIKSARDKPHFFAWEPAVIPPPGYVLVEPGSQQPQQLQRPTASESSQRQDKAARFFGFNFRRLSHSDANNPPPPSAKSSSRPQSPVLLLSASSPRSHGSSSAERPSSSPENSAGSYPGQSSAAASLPTYPTNPKPGASFLSRTYPDSAAEPARQTPAAPSGAAPALRAVPSVSADDVEIAMPPDLPPDLPDSEDESERPPLPPWTQQDEDEDF